MAITSPSPPPVILLTAMSALQLPVVQKLQGPRVLHLQPAIHLPGRSPQRRCEHHHAVPAQVPAVLKNPK